MKHLFFLAAVILVCLSSCMYVGDFGKRRMFLVGAHDDIKVKHNGKRIDVQEEIVGRETAYGGSQRTTYRHPTIKIKVRRNNKLELSSGGKTTQYSFKGKAGKGIVFLVLETPITLGIGPIVDLATLSFFYPPSKYIDVEAAFNDTEPKTKKELYKIALENSSKEVETR
ncbi:hypothetical protein CNR22_09000 [Sphingobacteriaceae bacterium]|nr:hypothetical protein CNR22_09000 [Sphingobacteriaceae bacterium]